MDHLHRFTTDNGDYKIKHIDMCSQTSTVATLYHAQAKYDKDDSEYPDKLECLVKLYQAEYIRFFENELSVLRACCRIDSEGYLAGRFPLYLGTHYSDDNVNCLAISRGPSFNLKLGSAVSLPDLIGLGEFPSLHCFPQPLSRAVHITKQVLEALTFIHSQSFILTNLNPKNILVSGIDSIQSDDTKSSSRKKYFDNVTLSGFEFAVEMSSSDDASARCYEYAAPELFTIGRYRENSGSSRNGHKRPQSLTAAITEKTDTYGAIAVLLYMISGKSPFVGTKEECEINCVNLDSENSYERHFFHRLKGLFSDRILNNFGLDGPNPNRRNGLRHLMYHGLRQNTLRRWGPRMLALELERLLNNIEEFNVEEEN